MGGRAAFAGLAVSLALGASVPAQAETFVEHNAEFRMQLDFVVPDAALRKFLPSGWEPNIATQGPAKDCNLRMIFIDRVAIMGGAVSAMHYTGMAAARRLLGTPVAVVVAEARRSLTTLSLYGYRVDGVIANLRAAGFCSDFVTV